jgi:trigger factor
MAAIAKKHEVQVTEEDVEKAYAELAAQSGKNVAKVRAEYREPGRRDMLVSMIIEDKVLDIIEGKAHVKDATAAEVATGEQGTEETAPAAEAETVAAGDGEKAPKKKKAKKA